MLIQSFSEKCKLVEMESDGFAKESNGELFKSFCLSPIKGMIMIILTPHSSTQVQQHINYMIQGDL